MRRMLRIDSALTGIMVLGLLSVILLSGCGRGGPSGPPNVVMIMTDTLRADKLSCYGFPRATTPELDALAKKGVVFERAIAPCSWTRPSMGSILTGLYPRRLGLYKEKDEILADRFDTLAEILRRHGYQTVGLTANPVTNSIFNFQQGFDEYVDSNVIFSWMPQQDGEITARNNKLIPAKEMFRKALDLVARNDPARPQYLQITIMEMHEYWRKRSHLIRPEYLTQFLDAGEAREVRYLQALRQVSVDIDDFVNALRARPGWDNTLFVILGDHGEGLKDHPHVARSDHHGRLLYESNIVVPFILYHTDARFDGLRVKRPVRLLDLAPTILSLLELPVPEDLHGVSLKPLTGDPDASVPLPEQFVAETYFRTYSKAAVYAADWNYIEARDRQRGTKPRELQPRGGGEDGKLTDKSEEHPEVVNAMASFLREWERQNPKEEATQPTAKLSKEEEDQLRAIGYLGG